MYSLFPRWHFLDERANAGDDFAGSLSVLDNSLEGLTRLLYIRRMGSEPAQSSICIGDYSRDRLVDFMGNRSRQLAESRQPIDMSKFCSRVLQCGACVLIFQRQVSCGRNRGNADEAIHYTCTS